MNPFQPDPEQTVVNPTRHATDSTSPAGIAISSGADQIEDDDLDLLAESGHKVTRLTIVLMAAVLAGVAFIGGALVQKQVGQSDTAFPASAMPAMGGQMPGGRGGYGGGGFAGSQQGTSGGAATPASAPVVVGTVVKVSGRTLTVKNFADKSVTVKVPKGTTISDSSNSALNGLAKGVSVSVVGKKAADGTVTATSITAK